MLDRIGQQGPEPILHQAGFATPVVKMEWPQTIAFMIIAPIGLFTAGINLAARALETRTQHYRCRLSGEDRPSSTAEVVGGEGRDVVTMFAGGLAGAFLGQMLAPDTDLPMFYAYWVLLTGLVIGIRCFHNYARRERQAALTHPWEPGVPPAIALEKLRRDYVETPRRTIWPATTTLALSGTTSVGLGVMASLRADLPLALGRTLPWLLVGLGVWVLDPSWQARTIAVTLAVASAGGTVSSVVAEFLTTRDYQRSTEARRRRLTERAAIAAQRDRLAAAKSQQRMDELATTLDRILTTQEELRNMVAQRHEPRFWVRLYNRLAQVDPSQERIGRRGGLGRVSERLNVGDNADQCSRLKGPS